MSNEHSPGPPINMMFASSPLVLLSKRFWSSLARDSGVALMLISMFLHKEESYIPCENLIAGESYKEQTKIHRFSLKFQNYTSSTT